MKKFILMLAAVATMVSCTSKKQQSEETTEATTAKTLVLYYSQTSTTKQVAEIFQQKLGTDIEAIELTNPYTGDFNATIARCQEEMATGTAPEIKALAHDLDAYDTIYLGFPVWFGTYALPISGLLNAVDLSGKTIVPFCTFGSGGLNTSSAALEAALPNTNILPGYGVRQARVAAAAAEVEDFLIRCGAIDGEVAALPEFSEQQPVTDAEKEVFTAACSSYSMPLGSPVTCGTRALANGTEYLFTTDGNTQIFVTAIEGATPEFTQVVR